MVYGIDVCYSIASFLVQLFYAIKKSLMALICEPKSPTVLPLSWKRPVTDTSANGTVKRTKDALSRPKVHPLSDDDDEHSINNVKSIEQKSEVPKEDGSGNADASLDLSKKSPGLKVNKKRPTMLVIPGHSTGEKGFGENNKKDDSFGKVSEVEGDAFCLFARKGGRHAMEDGYGTVNATIRDSQLVINLRNF